MFLFWRGLRPLVPLYKKYVQDRADFTANKCTGGQRGPGPAREASRGICTEPAFPRRRQRVNHFFNFKKICTFLYWPFSRNHLTKKHNFLTRFYQYLPDICHKQRLCKIISAWVKFHKASNIDQLISRNFQSYKPREMFKMTYLGF